MPRRSTSALSAINPGGRFATTGAVTTAATLLAAEGVLLPSR
ncbi:MAG: hypothetical protein ACRDTC_02255 [Pseudonocardiaceae bacterium]